jgi:hypothetical protein
VVSTSVESSIDVVANVESPDICRRYPTAPEEPFHESVRLVGWFVPPLTGEERIGGGGGAGSVEKFQAAEYALVPPALLALTRQ